MGVSPGLVWHDYRSSLSIEMRTESTGRRRSDLPDFVQTDVNVGALAEAIFARYAGPQAIVIEGTPSQATFFNQEYCPDFRVMKLA